MDKLAKELDICKSNVFMNEYSAFFGALMCNVPIHWDKGIPTAATNGAKIIWNPDWFQSLPEATRVTVLLHELNHIGRLHSLRLGSRDPRIWNQACDYRINADLDETGYTFKGTTPLLDLSYDSNGILSEEDIYELLLKTDDGGEKDTWGIAGEGGDLLPPEDGSSNQDLLNAVIYAQQVAKTCGGAVPNGTHTLIESFTKSKVNWNVVLRRYMQDLGDLDYSWSLPNKLYSHVYLPSLQKDAERLEHLAFILDVSGSISDEEAREFISEVKYIWDVMKPKRLTLVQFDTEIQKVDDYIEGDSLGSFQIIGRGGTNMSCIHTWIQKNKPTCSVVFSDMHCEPMESLPKALPVVWVRKGNYGHTPLGKVIQL